VIVALCTVFVRFVTNKDAKLQRLYNRIEADIEHRKWESALTHCQNYLKLTEHSENKGKYYSWVVDNTKFALCQTGTLLEDFFSYSKYEGFGILFSQNLDLSDMSHPGVYNFFSAMGLQSEAFRAAFNRVTLDGGNPFVFQNLIKSCLIAGDYRPCVLFINKLDESRPFRKQARHFRELLEDTAKLNTDSFYVYNRQLLPKTDFKISQSNIDFNVLGLWQSNSNNQRVGEYVVMMGLSAKQHAFLIQEIDSLLTKFDYRHIPRHIEEALLVMELPDPGAINARENLLKKEFSGLKIRKETLARYDEFFVWLEKYGRGTVSFSKLQDAFGDTYWFHFLFTQVPPPEGAHKSSGYDV
jgi:hypothetical protein